MTADIDAAIRFINTSARLLERHRLAHLLAGGDPEPVLLTLRAYRNPDGGFGNAIEPDMRAPDSQPVGIHTVMEILHQVGATHDPMIGPAADWLATVARPDGGVPFCLPSALDHPRNPIWQPSDTSSVIQTSANAAALHALGVDHPWLDKAGEFVFRWLDELDLANVEPNPGVGYEVRFAVSFLNAHPDEVRAGRALDALAPDLLGSGLIATEPGDAGDVQTPLDLAPMPGDRARRLFDQATIDGHLDALAAAQRDDGGWMFGWDQWNPAATLEWRGVLTVNALRVLRANARLT
jgi:hypothetical protein